MPSESQQFDAIVVGSGISGGWAAKELTERGLKVLVLERGKNIRHGADYSGEHAGTWKLPYYGLPDREKMAREYPIQRQSYACNEATLPFWNNDHDNPYIKLEDKPFNWMRADALGGRSLLWGRQTYRWSAMDFEANARDGHGIPWPVSYRDIAPWYSHVERFAGISGEAEGWDHLPDSEFLPPMDYYGIERTIKRRLGEKLPQVKVTMGRAAVLTREHQGRAPCHYCGPCQRGCSTGSYFSSQSSTLPAARATGNLTLLTDQVVEKLEHDASGQRITAVHCIDTHNGERRRYTARLFFLCASTVASTQIMLNSASDLHPRGLGNRSDALGRHLMDHGMITHTGIFIDDLDSYYQGNRPNGLYIPRFRNLQGQDDDASFLRGYGFQAMPIRPDWQLNFNRKGFGAGYKEALSKPGAFWMWALAGFIESLPAAHNRITLHPRKKDRFGIPQVVAAFTWSDNERALAHDTGVQAEKILRAAGAMISTIAPAEQLSEGGSGIHEMGTARMGDDPNQAVLNQYNRAHELDNLYVTDGSFMTSSACVNPSLTYMAFTARACDHAVRQLNEQQLRA
ncbi:GMC family oxidoreductase [Parahaliea mediterranea]|uniref:GMC family oxidoreductase n=1 Tax=Parahaliea mediterranea TaxID=651086 RepID=UPI000E2F1F63|nr:GMC family oxidoreductase [Parahaliea mediterranea]